MTAALIFSMGTLLCPHDYIVCVTSQRAAGAAGSAAGLTACPLPHPARTHAFRPHDALRTHRDAVPDLDRQRPCPRALHSRPEPARGAPVPGCGLLHRPGARLAGVLVRGARSCGAGAADPGVHGGMAGVSGRHAVPAGTWRLGLTSASTARPPPRTSR